MTNDNLKEKWKSFPTLDDSDAIANLIEPQESGSFAYDDDDNYDDGDIVTGNYQAPEVKGGVLNTLTNEIADPDKIDAWDVIVHMSKIMDIEIQDPKSGCRHCFGRGWIGRDTKTRHPVPCSCIYPPKTEAQKHEENAYMNKVAMANMNRSQRRRVEKKQAPLLRKMARQYKKDNEVNE